MNGAKHMRMGDVADLGLATQHGMDLGAAKVRDKKTVLTPMSPARVAGGNSADEMTGLCVCHMNQMVGLAYGTRNLGCLSDDPVGSG